MFHDRSLLERCFQGFVLNIFEYCSAVQCSALDTHLKQLDRAVSAARFLTGGVFECDIAHRRSVAVPCMLCKTRCNPLHPLNGALPGPYVPARVTHGALVTHRYTYAQSRCRTSQYRRLLFPSQCAPGTISLTLYSILWDCLVSRAGPMLFYWHTLLYSYYPIKNLG